MSRFNPLHSRLDIVSFCSLLSPGYRRMEHRIRADIGQGFLSPCRSFDMRESRRKAWSFSVVLVNGQYIQSSSSS